MRSRATLPIAAALLAALVGPARVTEVAARPGVSAPLAVRLGGDVDRAARARTSIIELDLPAAKAVLDGADPADPSLALERARLALYDGDYDAAAALLSRADLAATPEGAELGGIALGCARGMAATLTLRDDERGVVVRFQDDDDRALMPLIADTVVKVRATLAKDLGVELPKPLHLDLVRDQFTLAAMTGLPEKAAQTTGTVAVAKWGRVTMISPRAPSRGYPWLDTLAHEMTHLALSRGTLDKAPLWLQEGVAKREETRWREPEPLDDFPPIDSVAAVGFEKGLGLPLDKLGPSIAMLPTPEQASVAFAEVQSFIQFWAREVGDEALPQLVLRLRAATNPDDVNGAIQEVSGVAFTEWDKRWRAYLAMGPRDLPAELAPGGAVPNAREVVKRVRLGQLLDRRQRHKAAAIELRRAQTLVPTDPSIRGYLSGTLIAGGDRLAATAFVANIDDVHSRYGRWWSLHGLLHTDPAPDRSFALGIALDPFEPLVACEEKAVPGLPQDLMRAALCEMARRVPQ